MMKRQYAGELSEVMSPTFSDKDSELSPSESMPSSPVLEQPPSLSALGYPPTAPSRPSDQDEDSFRTLYNFQADQICLAHQTLTQPDDSNKSKEKDRAKRSNSRSSLIGRRFRRLSRIDSSSQESGTEEHQQQQQSSLDEDYSRNDPVHANLAGGTGSASRRTSVGGTPITAGSLFRWIFSGGQGNGGNKVAFGNDSSSESFSGQGLDKSEGHSSTSSNCFTLQGGSNDQLSDIYRHIGNNPPCGSQVTSILRFELESRKYPEHLNTYVGRAITELATVLNEYVDWLAQCHAYGVKSKTSTPNGTVIGQPQPGGVPGIGLGPTGPNSAENLFIGFSVFSLSMGGVVDANTIAGHQEEWISPGMAQMMMIRFPGLVVEWPKFWNNSREASGPPPGPITTLPALAVVNNPLFSLGKGAVGGVGGGISAGAGGSFGGASLNGTSGNGPSSLKHQQQAQLHHQQQMQLWSRHAAAVAAAAAAAAANAAASVSPSSMPAYGQTARDY